MDKKPVRIFPNTVLGVVSALEQIFKDDFYADRVVDRLLKSNKKWGKRDRAFIAENVYNIVRYWRLIWALLDKEPDLSKEMLYKVFGTWWLHKGNTLPDWPEFKGLSVEDINNRYTELAENTELTESYAEWFSKRAKSELKDQWPVIAKNSNLPALVALRVNSRISSKPKVLKALAELNIETVSNNDFPEVIFLAKRPKLNQLEIFKKGWFEIQDAGSQEIAKFLLPKPNDIIIDACSGAGGKALHLANLMENSGEILSMDVEGLKLKEQRSRAERNKASNIRTQTIHDNSFIKEYQHFCDRLLLDVPCSGTGVIKREPDTKWKLTEEKLESVIAIQKKILSEYSKMLKPGGTMVYATCSILKSENENQVNWFLENNKDFKLDDEKTIYPNEWSDGFFMARLIKTK